MSLKIEKSLNGEWMLLDGDLTVERFPTEAAAKKGLRAAKRDESINEMIEDAILDLKLELRQQWDIEAEEAHRLIREYIL